MASNIRRRRWPLFFEPRRRFKKKILKILIQINRILRYMAQVAVRAVRGQARMVVLEYLMDLRAAVKSSRIRILSLEFRQVLGLRAVKKAAAAAVEYFRTDLSHRISKGAVKPNLSYEANGPRIVIHKSPKGFRVRFCSYDDYERYIIVCVDKLWGESGCKPWTGDWYGIHDPNNEAAEYETENPPHYYGPCIDSPYFLPTRVLTAVTSSDAGYYYTVEFIDSGGNTVKMCDFVDRRNPCYLQISEIQPNP
jgi:hypothetical protein